MIEDIQSSVAQNEQSLAEVATNLKRQSFVSMVGFENEAIASLQQVKILRAPTSVDISATRFVSGNPI